MTPVTTERKIVARECRFAIHIPTRSRDIPDLHLVKEVVHYDDKTTAPNVVLKRNVARPFWVTKPQYRNHEQKKESEPFAHLAKYECTQSDLAMKVSQALGRGWQRPDLRSCTESPYLYGADISSTSLIKHSYSVQYPEAITPYSVCYFDTETDVVRGTNDCIIATMVFEDHLVAFVDKVFVQGYDDPAGRFNAMLEKLIKADLDKHQFKIEFILVDGPVEIIQGAFKRIHAWSPDFVAIWNLNYDIPNMIETLEKNGVDPKDVFSDPRLPPEYRFCKYKKGSTKKITASGQVKPKNPSEQWHSLYVPAGFYIIDAMCSYRFVRQGAQEEPSYSLDAILGKELNAQKLRIAGTEGLEGLDLHYEMQTKHPFEYLAYACVDVIKMKDLELKTNDLSQAVPTQSKFTDFARYASQTKRFSDRYTFFLLDRGEAIGCTPPPPKQKAEVDTDDIADDDDDAASTEGEDDAFLEDIDENGNDLKAAVEIEYPENNSVLSLKDWINDSPFTR